ncbi:MAG: DUF11 domain-containing protein [Actinobacteria bacterium]|nr:DUF11 domain-containing protein [Actinomycetota bacterium]
MRSVNVSPSARRRFATRLALLLAAISALAAFVAPAALAAPGAPAAPSVVYTENFENGVAETPVPLTSYVGATGETYTADPAWLSGCNGTILEYKSPDADQPTSGCNLTSYSGVRQLAYALGLQDGSAVPETNHAVTAYTEGNRAANLVEFKTVNEIPLAATGRFLTFRVDVAAVNCQFAAPLYTFYLTAGATETQVGSQINGCASPTTVSVPAVGNVGATTARIGTYTSNGSVLFNGSSLGILMRNATGNGSGNDAAFDNIEILDVSPTLDKSFNPPTQYVGRPSTLTFTITNTSELSAKEGWSFTDNLPAGLLVASPAGASTTCPGGQVTAAPGGTSVAVKGNLNTGEASCNVSVQVIAKEEKEGTFENGPRNVAMVGLNPPGPVVLKYIAPDVAIEKSMTPRPLVPGKEGEYHLKVTNKGPGTAEGVVVSDPLPNGITFLSGSPGCSVAAGTVTCEAGSLAEGASRTFDLKVKVASSLQSCPSNTASVISDTPDLNHSDNTSQVCPPVGREVDLQIEKTAAPTTVTSGGQVTYTLVVKNNGPSDASEVKVVDPGANGLDLVAAKPSQGSCSITGDSHLSCSLGDLVAGGSAQVLVTAKATINSGDVDNTATVSAAEKETDPANNQSSARIMVLAGPVPPPAGSPLPPGTPHFDLVTKKTAKRKKIAAGQTATYTITVTNKGPDTAPNVTVKDTFNHAGALVSAKPSAGSCGKTLPLSCSLGDIKPGATVTVTVVVRPLEAAGPQVNAASATGEGTDEDSGDNLAKADIGVTPKLGIVKTVDRRSVKAGATLHYTIRVTNLSKGVAARDVKTCDRLPSGLALIGSKPKATLSKGVPCWTAAKLGAGKSVVYRVTAKVLSSAKGSLRNVATVTGPGGKPVRSSAPVTVQARAPKPTPTPVTG